jgi:hypothetical protein
MIGSSRVGICANELRKQRFHSVKNMMSSREKGFKRPAGCAITTRKKLCA